MKKIAYIIPIVLLLLAATACSDNRNSSLAIPSSTSVEENNSEAGIKPMIDETMLEAERLNSESWFGGMNFLQTVSQDDVGADWYYEMPDGLDGRCFQYPTGDKTRLTDITIQDNVVNKDGSYSLYGIELDTPYSEAASTLISEGYEAYDESELALPNPSAIEKRRRFIKYDIWITLYLTGSDETTAKIQSINCLASDPSTSSNDYAY